MSAATLSCQELVELVTDYLEGALPPEERARFEHHLERCRGCTNYVEQIRITIALTGPVHADELDPSVCDAIVEAFRDWSRAD
jgi:anti-sigma factor RsiW